MISSYLVFKAFLRDPLQFLVNQKLTGRRVPHLKFFGKNLFLVSEPDDVTLVLKTANQNFIRGKTLQEMQKFLGKGLITNDGEEWRKQHVLIRPTMSPRTVAKLAPEIKRICDEFVPLMHGEVNALVEMNKLAWRIVLRALFSRPVTTEMDDWLTDILEMLKFITAKVRAPIKLPMWIPTKKNRRFKAIVKKFDSYVYGMIKDRRSGERKEDFLQFLIDSHEVGIESMTDLKLRDEVMTFLMAGHETITNTMSWALIELARNPQYMPQLQKESDAFATEKDFEKLLAAPFLGAVIDEVMRLWPPVWVTRREVAKEATVGDVTVPAGATVLVSPFLSHRDPKRWENAEAFHPERFIDKKYPSGQFYPFGLGPRACIGAHFAGLEARTILATIVHHYEWEILDPRPQRSVAEITLRPANNLKMNFRARHAPV
jgi:cytochrome P450